VATRFLFATLVVLLLASPAFAGGPITEFPAPRPAPGKVLGPDGLPVPERAAAISGRNTLLPLTLGTILCTAGIRVASVSARGDDGLGVGLCVIGAGVATTGLVAGPSSGYSYGGLSGRATAGTLVRLGSLVGAPVAIVLLAGPRDREEGFAFATGLIAGVGLVILESVYDVATVEGAVRRHNATLPRATSWRLEPCVTPSAHAPGLALRARFGGPEGS
jgi:hypothetical protein